MPCRRVHDRDAGGNGADEPSALDPAGAPQGPGVVPPRVVQPVEQLYSDVKYLAELLDLSSPPRQRMRASETACFYLPGNASGSGFGSALIGEAGIEYEAGTWDSAWREESSNFREADNLVQKVEDLVRGGKLGGHEIFVFTDNFVFESTFYKGYSKVSPKLSDIIMRLHKIERDGDLILHVVHVAGTRMKSWGVDGLSRGDLMEGMMGGLDPLSFMPVANGADI